MNGPNVTIPQCTSLNSAGRRCEKSELHNTVEINPLHKAGAVTWNSAQGERLSIAEALQRAMGDLKVTLDPWQQQVAETYFGEPEPSAEQQLAQWWREKAETEIEQTVAKAVEYGSTDLIDIGRSIARVAGLDDLLDEEYAEMGIFFYLEGKLSRWRSALERGDRPSDDTLLDIGVYSRMAQRIRSHGGWPGTEETPGSPPAPVPDLRKIKIAEVNWNGRDITSFMKRKPDGSLDTSFESVGEAAEKAGFARTSIDPEQDSPDCSCNECKDGHA